MKPKVLMVGPSSLGGISALIQILIPALAPRVDLKYLVTVQGRNPAKAGRVSLMNLDLAITQYMRFIKTVIQFRPEIIHLHTSQGLGWLKDTFFVLCGKIFGAHVILHIHASDFDKFYAGTPRLIQAYTHWVVQFVDAVLVVSEQWQDHIAQIVSKDRIHKFINCININTIRPHKPLSNNGHKTEALFLGAVGERKGVPELLHAMGHLKSKKVPLHLYVAGSEEKGGDLARMQTLISELHLEGMCELTGDVREERKFSFLESVSMFVLPSHHEGMPIALLEGMAAGLSVVSTPVGGIPEIITDGYNGFLVPPGDVEALTDKLAILANNPQLCQEMGSRNREIAIQTLGVDNYAARLQALYESML